MADLPLSADADQPSLVTEVSEFISYHRICLGMIRKITHEFEEVLGIASPKYSRPRNHVL